MPTPEQRIREFYGFDFPEEFFRFREFLADSKPGLLGDATDMDPAFAFDVADGKPTKCHPDNPQWEDRYYYDLPEFVTIFDGSDDGRHWGYFFDDPGRAEPVVAWYWHSDTFQHNLAGDTIFEAVRMRVERDEQEFDDMLEEEEGEEDYARKQLGKLQSIREKLARYWGSDRPEVGAKYERKYDRKSRRKPVAETFSDLGVVVPRHKYRELSSDPIARKSGGRKVKSKRAKVEGLIAEATESVKEYPGAALKLGHDLWVWAREYPALYDLLDAAYEAMDRQPLRQRLRIAKEFRAWCEGR